MSSESETEKEISVGVLATAFRFPASMSKADIFAACQQQLGLESKKNLQLCQMTPFKRGRSTLSDKPLRRKFVCYVPKSEFTLDFIANTFEKNGKLTEQVEKGAEALIAFQQQLELNRREIISLRKDLAVAEEALEAAEGKHKEELAAAKELAENQLRESSSKESVTEGNKKDKNEESTNALATTEEVERWKQRYEKEKARGDKLEQRVKTLEGSANAAAKSKAKAALKSPRNQMGCRGCDCTQFRSGTPSWICALCSHTLVRHCVSTRDLNSNKETPTASK